jgi:hypothetical protein
MSSEEEPNEMLLEMQRLASLPVNRRLAPAQKAEELTKAYVDAKERGEDASKALREKYRELNPEPERT